MKNCTKCDVEKPSSEYYKHRGGLYSSCKECKKKSQASRYEPNPIVLKSNKIPNSQTCSKCNIEKSIKNFRYRKDRNHFYTICIDCQRLSHICKTYLVNIDKAVELHNTNKCSICDVTVTGKNQCVDHSHKSGIVRGILCSNCNRGLGYFNDNIYKLANAIKYLNNNE